MENLPVWLPVLFFVVAVLYSSVGFAGGSSYAALLVIVGVAYTVVPQTALVCNLIVSAGGVWHFVRGGHFNAQRTVPFLLLSIPMAYLGGRMAITREVFMVVLGISLLAAGGRLLIDVSDSQSPREVSRGRMWMIGLPLGGALGFLAGIVGIGGGIFLAPVLLLTGWARAKTAAAAASVFILLNSIAGLSGQLTKGVFLDAMVLPLAIAVVLGGQLGSRMGSYHLPALGVRRLLAALICAVGVRLLWLAV